MFIVAYAFMYALALIQLGVSAGALPDNMATHFMAGGAPNGYMTKASFIIFYLGFMFFMPGITGWPPRAATPQLRALCAAFACWD